MTDEVIESLANDSIVNILAISMMFDIVLGLLRALKEKKFNSTIGINGAIRKVAMLACVGFLMCIDCIIRINLLFMIPNEYIELFGFQELGLCEFFSLVFMLYESISILKNMVCCNLPVPQRIKNKIEEFLKNITTELDNKNKTP